MSRPGLPTGILLGLLLALGCADAPPRHAVLVVIDTLRADALERARTPQLDALAARGARAELAWSSATWTVPSVISLFTGRHVRDHGWDVRRARVQPRLPPLPDTPTLAEVLAGVGFETAALYANPILSWEIGFGRGFERWERTSDAELPDLVAAEVAGWEDGQRHFLYLHLLGPHEPLAPGREARLRWQIEAEHAGRAFSIDWVRESADDEEFAARAEIYSRAYHAVVEDTDTRLGRILAALEPILDDAVLVVTSDHGEMLGERRRMGHGPFVFEALTRVPLLAVGAGRLPPRISSAAVPDLLTSALAVEHAWSVRADRAAPLVSQRAGRMALSPDGRFKVFEARGERLRAFDLAADPGEQEDLVPVPPALEAALAHFQERVPAGSIEGTVPVRVDKETLEALRALGYVDPAP